MERWRAATPQSTTYAPMRKRTIALAAINQENQFTRNWIAVLITAFAIAFLPNFLAVQIGDMRSYGTRHDGVSPFVVPCRDRVGFSAVMVAASLTYPARAAGEELLVAWIQRLRSIIACAVARGIVLTALQSSAVPRWQFANAYRCRVLRVANDPAGVDCAGTTHAAYVISAALVPDVQKAR